MKQTLPISKLVVNSGQIPGLPQNPRFIRDDRFAKLKKSIVDFPEMLDLREVIVFPFEEKFVIIGGNMRFLACKDLGHKQIPAKVLPSDFPLDKLKEFAIKDNRDFGEDDMDLLANEWSDLPLDTWGMDLPELSDFMPNLDPETEMRKVSAEDIVKTQAELDEHYKDKKHKYLEVACPSCAETFYINPE